MRKCITTILIGLFFFLNSNHAQIVLKIANVQVDPGTPTATVDVTIDGFINIQAAQFAINYDSLIIGFNSVTNLNTTLNLSPSPGANFGFPGTGNIKKGQLTFSWSDQNLMPRTLPDGTRLFSIVFNVLGGEGASSDITQTNIPLKIEYVRDFTEVTNFSSQKGSVKVKGNNPNPTDPCPDVVCNNPNNLTFTGDTVTAKKGDQICVPFKVKNFINIQGGQGTFSWDTTQLKFVSIKSNLLTGTLFLTPPAVTNGIIRYSYFNNTPDEPLNATDNTVAFEICFEVLASPDANARICMGKVMPPEMDWAAQVGENTVSVPFCVKAGTVLIREIADAPPVKIKVSNSMGNKGSNVCLDITVENFNDIRNMQFSFNWNTTMLEYVSTGMYDLKGLNQGSFTNLSSFLNLSWNTGDNSVTSVPNGHKIFQVCFKLIGDCDAVVPVQITGTPLKIEINGIYDGQNDYEFDSEITNGQITINCPMGTSTCVVNAISAVSCFGGSNGTVTATVTPAPALTNCMCVWKNSQGAIIKSSANLSDCNLTNVAAGAYKLELICNNAVQCTSDANVGQADRVNVPATGTTNVSCEGKGSISVTGITGGNPPFNTYAWDPNVGSTANISNLDAGNYKLTVTDSKGCTGTQSFDISDSRTNLVATAVATPVKCFGGMDGSISVISTGGCPPYTITGAVSNLSAGSYSITVTDASVPANSVVVSATVSQPTTPVTIVTTTVDSDAGSNNGSISLSNTGGTQPYTITWQSTATQIAQNTNPAINLRPGFYNVTVTDANGCTAVAINIEVKEKVVGPTKAVFEAVAVSSNFNGFGVDCQGNCTGKIAGTLASGSTPVKVSIKNGALLVKEVTLNAAGPFEFDQLCAGTYTVEGLNNAGLAISGNITITTPTKLTSPTPTIACTNGDDEDGSITLQVNTSGTPPYNYQWSNPVSTTNELNGLGVGVYGVTITDANNCTLIINNLDVKPCSTSGGDDCGVGTIVLTPDGNQQNDVFIISCAEELNGSLSMFDRWGRLVYNKSPYDNTFIGIDNKNNVLNEGAYIWIYEVNYGSGVRDVFNGTLTILR
ncbi:MAG: gliding motility-associated C-terminal domain-containing protein [Saprospiraceae bacterium]